MGHLDVVRELKGETALFVACSGGDLGAVERLIRAGEDVNTPDGKGQTPLHIASEKNRLAVVRTLLEACADVSKPGQPSTQSTLTRAPSTTQPPKLSTHGPLFLLFHPFTMLRNPTPFLHPNHNDV